MTTAAQLLTDLQASVYATAANPAERGENRDGAHGEEERQAGG
jgi:hypothetical protein